MHHLRGNAIGLLAGRVTTRATVAKFCVVKGFLGPLA